MRGVRTNLLALTAAFTVTTPFVSVAKAQPIDGLYAGGGLGVNFMGSEKIQANSLANSSRPDWQVSGLVRMAATRICTALGFWDTGLNPLRRLGGGLKLLLTERCRADEAVAFDQPGCIVGVLERQQGLTQFFDRFEVSYPEKVLLQGADEPLGTAVALGRSDEGRRTLDAEECDLLLEMLGHVLRPVVMAHRETTGAALCEPAEMPAHALADRFQRLEAGGPRVCVDANAFGGAMINRDEHRGLTFAGKRRRQISPPHGVHRRGDDGAVMIAWSAW